MNDPELILITGVTGTLGQELLAHFVRNTQQSVALIVRRKDDASSQDRVERIIASWGLDPANFKERIGVIEGDVSQPGMGMTAGCLDRLRQRTTAFYHLAALTKLDADPVDHFRINVEGTREAIRLAGRLPKLKRFVHFSTAFVVGSRFDAEAFEDELPRQPGHSNPYEASKYVAEREVREAMNRAGLPATILRPSIVVGDQEEGRLPELRVIYPFVRLFARGFLTSLPARPDAVLDLVPVDFVARAAVGITGLPGSLGKTYHLVSPSPPTVDLFLRLLSQLLPTSPEIRVVEPESFHPEDLSGQEQVIFKSLRPYMGYLNREIRFHTENTQQALQELGLAFPTTDENFLRKIFEYQISIEQSGSPIGGRT